jgi:hypothetical protein
MSIIEIAKIQIRRGQELITGTPNLDPGEFGWAQDTEHLYIGKSITEGADSNAPTRVLTEPDLQNVFSLIGSINTTATINTLYTYRLGNDYLSHTSTSTIQTKLDSLNPSLYDFGVVSTSTVVDITQELKDAVRDLFRNEGIGPDWLGSNAQDLRRQLIIPAGTYIVNDTVKLPPYASVVGAGPNRTTLIFNNTVSNLFETIDLAGNDYDSNDMQSGAIRAREVYIGNMTLQFSTATSGNNSLISLDNVLNARVENCVLKSDVASQFENSSTSTYVLHSGNTATFYTSNINVNYFEGQQLIISYDGDNFLRGEVVSYNTGTGALVVAANGATQQFGVGTYSDWTIRIDDYFTSYGFAIHGVGIQLRGTGGGITGDVNLCENIKIKDCIFDGLKNGVQGYGSVMQILIENNTFNNLDSGIRFWSPDLVVPAPTNAHVLKNRFQNILKEGFHVDKNADDKPTYHVSEGNSYIRVGNGPYLDDNVQSTNSCTTVIRFWSTGNKSINDYFSRRIAANESTDPLFYYFPLMTENVMVRDDSVYIKTVVSNATTPVTKFYLTDKDQKIDVNYQMSGNGLSRKGTLLLNVASDGYVSYTDYYNYSQTVQSLDEPFYVTEPLSTSSFTILRTTATNYIDTVNAAGNWYIVGVNDENIGGQIVSITTATSAGSPYFAGAQYYTIDVAAAPFVDFTVNPSTTSYDFAYSDFEQPTVNVNTASIGTTTNWASLEVISGSEFDMMLEYRIDQQL